MGAPFTRGAFTTTLGSFSSPVWANSSTSGGNSKAVWCIWCAWFRVAMLKQNSPVSRMLTKVSFRVTPSDFGCRVRQTIGGLRPAPVKKEIGARLATPTVDTLLIQPIARGNILPISSL